MVDWNVLTWIGVMLGPTSLIAVYEAWRHPRFLRTSLVAVIAAAAIAVYVPIRSAFHDAQPGRPFLVSNECLAVVGPLFGVHVVVVGAIVRSDNVEFATNVAVLQRWFEKRAPKFGEEELPVAGFAEFANSLSAYEKWLVKPGVDKTTIATSDAVDTAIVDRLRQLAQAGATFEEMVEEARTRLGFSPDSARDPYFITPVQYYFCEAFSLGLADVQPLEKWVKTDDDRLAEALMLRIKEFREPK